MAEKWEADPSASFVRRLGKSSHELGQTSGNSSCPDIWEFDNGDVAVIGSDLTTSYEGRLPEGVSVDPGERLVIIPRRTVPAENVRHAGSVVVEAGTSPLRQGVGGDG